MMLEFQFDEEKVTQANFKLESCYECLDEFILQGNGMKKISKGVYQGQGQLAFETVINSIHVLKNKDWFLRTIGAWYCREDGDEIENRVDYLGQLSTLYPDKAEKYEITKSTTF